MLLASELESYNNLEMNNVYQRKGRQLSDDDLTVLKVIKDLSDSSNMLVVFLNEVYENSEISNDRVNNCLESLNHDSYINIVYDRIMLNDKMVDVLADIVEGFL